MSWVEPYSVVRRVSESASEMENRRDCIPRRIHPKGVEEVRSLVDRSFSGRGGVIYPRRAFLPGKCQMDRGTLR
jgi:hypothetical protein